MFIYIWMLTLYLIFVFADMGPQGCEAKMVGEIAHQGLVRPSRVGEKCQRDDVSVGPADELREDQRCRFDDPGAGSSHVPRVGAIRGWRIFVSSSRRCFSMLWRACCPTFRMRESWSSVWVFW